MDRARLQVVGLDHIVLVVADVERSLAFYTDELGLAPVQVDEWRRGEFPFPSVRVSAETIIDLFANTGTDADGAPADDDGTGTRNLDHFCLVVEPTDLGQVAASGAFGTINEPGPRFGAQGQGTSIYIKDPDGNTIELRHY